MDAKRVVIIDDEMVLGQLLQAAFATLSGHIEVSVVPSAEEASAEFNKNPLHLIVSDVKLPGMSGLEFSSLVRKKNTEVKIILVSGLNDPHLREKAMAAGADAFYPKPVEMRDFLETSARYLGLTSQSTHMSTRQVIDLRSDLLVDILISLRQDLSAIAVSLIDDHGKVIASAGDAPDENLAEKVTPYLIAATNSIKRVNATLQPEIEENVISIRGSVFDLVVSPVSNYLMVVFLKHTRSSVRMAVAFDALIDAMNELNKKISEINEQFPSEAHPEMEEVLAAGAQAAAAQAPVEVIEAVTAIVGEVGDFDQILSKAKSKSLKTEEVEDFWESATAAPSFSDAREPGLLSFDEASQLGLTPKDGES